MTLTPGPADGPGVGVMPGTTAYDLLARTGRDDYREWLSHTATARGCSHPVRLTGEITDVDPATGEIIRRVATADMPDGVL